MNTDILKKKIMNIETTIIDIYKLGKALENVEGLSKQGEIIREDLFGLLYFGIENPNQFEDLYLESLRTDKK